MPRCVRRKSKSPPRLPRPSGARPAARASRRCARASPRAPRSMTTRSRGVAEDARRDRRAVIGRHRVDAARDLQHVARARVGAQPRRRRRRSSAPTRSRYRPRFFENDTASSASGTLATHAPHRARHPRRAPRRSPDRRDPGTAPAARRRSSPISASHCALSRSAPVGLWQHACSSTTSPAGARVEALEHGREAQPCARRRRNTDSAASATRNRQQRHVVAPARIADLHPGRRAPPRGSVPRRRAARRSRRASARCDARPLGSAAGRRPEHQVRRRHR